MIGSIVDLAGRGLIASNDWWLMGGSSVPSVAPPPVDGGFYVAIPSYQRVPWADLHEYHKFNLSYRLSSH